MSETEKRYGMVIDLGLCVDCHACTVSCKMENQVGEGFFNTWVEEWDVGEYPNVAKARLPKLCNHCKDAPCIPVCPVDATYAVQGGAVVVDEETCIGCGACVTACPYDARYLNADNKAGKCTFCIERAESGLMPACVSTCVSHARVFGDLNNPDSQVSKLMKEKNILGLQEDLGLDLSVKYIGLDKINQSEDSPEKFKGGKK